MIDGVIDITTTEVADFIGGGVFPCLEDRFGAIARTRVPYVVSCGALDMVNFGEKESVPERYCDRKFYFHNPQVTLMRTNVAENRRIGELIATRLNQCDGPVCFLIPETGIARKSVVWGKSVSVSVELGGRRIIKKKKTNRTAKSMRNKETTRTIPITKIRTENTKRDESKTCSTNNKIRK